MLTAAGSTSTVLSLTMSLALHRHLRDHPGRREAGSVPNTATVTAVGPDGTITDTDQAPVTVNGQHAVELIKSAVAPTAPHSVT